MKACFGIIILLALVTAPLGVSQSGGDNGSSNGGSSSTANSGSNATVVNNVGGGGGGMQVQAFPGPTSNPGPFPGFPMSNGDWGLYFNGMLREVPVSVMRAGRKHAKIKSIVLVKNALPQNDDPIHLINWSPFGNTYYLDDKIIGVVDVRGEAFEPPEAALLAGLYEAKEKMHASRCVAFIRQLNVGITKGFSIGTGGAGGLITSPGKNNDSVAFAAGGVLGTNKVYRSDFPEFRIVCLNDGPLEAPKAPEPPKPEKVEPAPPPPPPPAPAPHEEPAPQAQTPPPAPVVTAPPVDPCADLPKVTIYFDFDRSVVKPEYRDKIQSIADWMQSHPSCKVSIEGYASREASNPYNDHLGEERAQHVYEILALNKSIADRLPRYLSGGKHFITHTSRRIEYNKEDRKVIFTIRNITSE